MLNARPAAATAFVMTAVMFVLLVVPAHALDNNWISIVSIHDVTGNSNLQVGQAMLTGHSYNMTIGINVPFSQNASKFTVGLYGGVNASGNQYWYVHGGYLGYNPNTLLAGSKNISFTQVKGVVSLSALFTLPKILTTNPQATVILHFKQVSFPIVQSTVTGGATVGDARVTISDQVIQDYESLYAQASNYVPTGRIDRTYGPIVNGTLTQAQALYQKGLVIEATNLLNTLDPAAFPAPPSNAIIYALFGGVGVLAVLTGIFGVMAIRSRAKGGYSSSIVGEVQRELSALEVIAVKYDRNLADKLKALRDKLTEASSR
jgi:hypothetical protein